jgi:rare lipoprotein A
VTNLENNRQIIVRVNDRGPFHKGRIIDLSYAAATKLGYANKGTAQVKLELIRTEPSFEINNNNISTFTDKVVHFIQVGAFSLKDSAEKILNQLETISNIPEVYIASASAGDGVVHRVRIGPFLNEKEAVQSLDYLKSKGFTGSQLIQRALSAKNI